MIKIGIIGCGKQANIHIQAMLETGLYEIVALCDIDKDNIDSLAASIGTKASIFATTDYKKCIDYPLVEAVLISTHTYQHVEQSLYAISKEKHVLVEKPISTNLEDFDKLAEAALKTNVVVYPGLEYHHSYLFDNLHNFVNSDFLDGTKYIAVTEYRNSFMLPWFFDKNKSGGAVNDKMIHFFDVVCSLFAPSKPVRVLASGSSHVYKKGSVIQGIMGENFKLETANIVDNAMIIVEFEDDKRASVNLNMYEKFPVTGLEFYIAGLNGTQIKVTHADTPQNEIYTNKSGTFERYIIPDKSDSDSLGAGHPGAKTLFKRFYDAIHDKKKQYLDIYGLRVAQSLTLAVEEALMRKEPVLMSEFSNETLDKLAIKAGAGFKSENISHDIKVVEREQKRPARRGLLRLFFGKGKLSSVAYIKLTRATLTRIIAAVKAKQDLPSFKDMSLTLKLTTPWDTMYIRVSDSIKIVQKDPTKEGDTRMEVTLTQIGFEGFLSGESLNRLYLSKQVTVSGDMLKARRFRPVVLKLLEEIKKQCLVA